MNSRFDPLRNMESFTEAMFNNIIAFQEKQHPAWDKALPFTQRIEHLPLHYLIFSSPDRDPNQFGPTVAHYYPFREEIQKIAYYTQEIGANSLADIYCGNGFIGSLIAREGIKVLGLTQYLHKPNQIERFHDTACYSFSEASFAESQCNAVFTSWIPGGENPSPSIVACHPRLIVYSYTDHINPQTQERQCGTDTMLTDLPDNYVLLDQWSVTRPENLLHAIWPDMTPNLEEIRHTRIYVEQNFKDIDTHPKLLPGEPYYWETEYNMAMLALEAKQDLQMKGFPV